VPFTLLCESYLSAAQAVCVGCLIMG